jgi:histone H3/H4
MKCKTAYFIFSEEVRDITRSELLKERGGDTKLSVADVAKEIGKKWKALTDEERGHYKQMAQAAGEAKASEEDLAQQADAPCANSKEEGTLDGLLPLTAVRRIILADTDVCRVSHEGIVAIAMATNLLLGILSKGIGNHARNQKRKTVVLKDFVQVLSSAQFINHVLILKSSSMTCSRKRISQMVTAVITRSF